MPRTSSLPAVRQAAVAGLFYPADPRELSHMVGEYLDAAPPSSVEPRALIAPHAGYIYSGPVAATAYRQLRARSQAWRRVLLLGPSHRVAFTGLALSSAESYGTPVGDIAIDGGACRELLGLPQVTVLDQAHAQ